MDVRVAARAGLPGIAAMVSAGGAIYIGNVMPAELVTISRLGDPNVALANGLGAGGTAALDQPCTVGPDRDSYHVPSLPLRRPFEVRSCVPMQLASGRALFVDLELGEENDVAIYGEDGHGIVAPTPVPFDPYPHADVIWSSYDVTDVDFDGVDEIIMQSTGWIRTLVVRDGAFFVTAEHVVLDTARSTARRAYAHDRLVPLRERPPVQEVAVCGELTFVLSRPMPISQVITTYSTKTGRLRLGPREVAPIRHLGCSLTIVHTGNAAMGPYDHLEVAPGARAPWPDWRTEHFN